MSLSNRKIAGISVMLALSLIMFMVENFFPPLFIPGAKLGLGNIFSLIAMCVYSPAYALLLSVLRCVLGNLIVGSLSSMLYGLCATIVSSCVGIVLYKFVFPRISLISVSITMAVIHNSVQCVVFCFVSATYQSITYLPYLILLGAVSGFATGFASLLLIKKIPMSSFGKLGIFENNKNSYKNIGGKG